MANAHRPRVRPEEIARRLAEHGVEVVGPPLVVDKVSGALDTAPDVLRHVHPKRRMVAGLTVEALRLLHG